MTWKCEMPHCGVLNYDDEKNICRICGHSRFG